MVLMMRSDWEVVLVAVVVDVDVSMARASSDRLNAVNARK
jgi:hypothetical protein